MYLYYIMEQEEINPKIYTNKLNEINSNIILLLDEFKTVYVNSKIHPANEEVQQRYEKMTDNINLLQSKLFAISNETQSSINDINEKLLKINESIQKEKKQNRKLKRHLGIAENKSNSAEEMYDDYKELYNVKYLRNWGLFLSMLIGIYTISKVYKKN